MRARREARHRQNPHLQRTRSSNETTSSKPSHGQAVCQYRWDRAATAEGSFHLRSLQPSFFETWIATLTPQPQTVPKP